MKLKKHFLLFLLCIAQVNGSFAGQQPKAGGWGAWFSNLFQKAPVRGFVAGAALPAIYAARTSVPFEKSDFIFLGPLILGTGMIGSLLEDLLRDNFQYNLPENINILANKIITPIIDDTFFFPTHVIKLQALLKRDMFIGAFMDAADTMFGLENANLLIQEACSLVSKKVQSDKKELNDEQKNEESPIDAEFFKFNREIAHLESIQAKMAHINNLMDVDTKAVFSAIVAFKFENFCEISWDEDTSRHKNFKKAIQAVYNLDMRNNFNAISKFMSPKQKALCAIGLQLKYKELMFLLYPNAMKRSIVTKPWLDKP